MKMPGAPGPSSAAAEGPGMEATALKGHGFTGCGKTPSQGCFVTGHEFTRAANAVHRTAGFSPC
jgi:hypothetical protein